MKHGPFYQLSLRLGRKSSTTFITKTDLPEARRRVKRYQQCKVLATELVYAYVTLTRKIGFIGRAS